MTGMLGFVGHAANQAFAAAGNCDVDVFEQPEEVANRFAVGGAHQLHCVGREANFGQRLAEQIDDRAAGVHGFLTAAEDHGIAAFDTDRCGIGRHVGTRLVNEKHDSQRHANF